MTKETKKRKVIRNSTTKEIANLNEETNFLADKRLTKRKVIQNKTTKEIANLNEDNLLKT